MDQSSVNASTVSLSLSLFLPISFIIDLLRQHLRYSFVSIHSFALTAFNAIFRGLFAFESIQHRRDETQSDIKQSNHSVKSYESVNSPFFFFDTFQTQINWFWYCSKKADALLNYSASLRCILRAGAKIAAGRLWTSAAPSSSSWSMAAAVKGNSTQEHRQQNEKSLPSFFPCRG